MDSPAWAAMSTFSTACTVSTSETNCRVTCLATINSADMATYSQQPFLVRIADTMSLLKNARFGSLLFFDMVSRSPPPSTSSARQPV